MHRGPTVDPSPLWASRKWKSRLPGQVWEQQLQPLSTSTFQEAKTLLRNGQRCQWRRANGDYSPSTDPINCFARHEQTTIFRLRTGHCSLRAYLKRTGIMDSALCFCKEAEQTAHHILQDCSIWRQQRHQLWLHDESTTINLWGTAEDLRHTIQFLATCRLRVWARLIDRRGSWSYPSFTVKIAQESDQVLRPFLAKFSTDYEEI